MITLQSCDIILFRNDRNDPLARFSRWAIGPYEHVAMYMGRIFTRIYSFLPMVYESRGRGVYIASLLPQTGKPVAVMRPILGAESYREKLLKTASEIAADEKSLYDYFCIVYSCIPRVLHEKLPPWLPIPIPVKYHRDIFMICSEAVAEVFWRNGFEVLPEDTVPLPVDFVLSPVLQYVGQGKLIEDILW